MLEAGARACQLLKIDVSGSRLQEACPAILKTNTRRENLRQPWLGDMAKHVGYKVLGFMAYQHRIALTPMPSTGDGNPPILRPRRVTLKDR